MWPRRPGPPARAYSSNQITCWCRLRPRPPCSLGQPTQFQPLAPRWLLPGEALVEQGVLVAGAAAALDPREVAVELRRSSQLRASARKASSSSEKRRSMPASVPVPDDPSETERALVATHVSRTEDPGLGQAGGVVAAHLIGGMAPWSTSVKPFRVKKAAATSDTVTAKTDAQPVRPRPVDQRRRSAARRRPIRRSGSPCRGPATSPICSAAYGSVVSPTMPARCPLPTTRAPIPVTASRATSSRDRGRSRPSAVPWATRCSTAGRSSTRSGPRSQVGAAREERAGAVEREQLAVDVFGPAQVDVGDAPAERVIEGRDDGAVLAVCELLGERLGVGGDVGEAPRRPAPAAAAVGDHQLEGLQRHREVGADDAPRRRERSPPAPPPGR